MPVGLARLGALGLDRQLAVSHGDLDVVGRVDAGKLGANLVEPFLHLVFQPQQVAVEKRTQTCERRKVGEAPGKPLKSSDSSGSKGRD